MLQHSFIHIQGVGPVTEERLWHDGILTWDDFMSAGRTLLGPGRDILARRELEASQAHRDDARYFAARLPSQETWRLFETFAARTAYLDIETSGGLGGTDEITVIGLYDGHAYRAFVSGHDLHDFEVAIADYAVVVTFNGTCFDLPFIRRQLRHVSLPAAHIDLRFLLRRLGFKGGLKRIETDLEIRRDTAVEGLSGYDAVLLWRAHQWGDPKALERLIAYNREDTVNLEILMRMAFQAMKRRLLLPHLT